MIIIKADDLMAQFKNQGFYYSKSLIFNYFNSLVSKPFIILTGISGSGKSKIAEIFSELVSETDKRQYELIPVKPNWRDNKGLFGYHNLVDNSYSITPLIRLFIRALHNSTNPYFLILDEMNIAKVEHYFADYLSLIESRRIKDIENKSLLECTLQELIANFTYENNFSLSMAIILAAFDLDKPDKFLLIEDYRNNKFVEKWKSQFSKSSSWTAQFREEFHKGANANRLAYKVFEPIDANGKLYKLKDMKDIANLTGGELKIVNDLRHMYDTKRLMLNVNDYIYQDNIVLHNCEGCLSPESGKNCVRQCPYFADEKYKCKYLYNEVTEGYLVPPQIPIPLNLFTIGTVNVDETTYMFSPKVLDRSNVIEFNEVNFAELYTLDQDMKDILSTTNMAFSDDLFFFDVGVTLPDIKITIPSKNNVNTFIMQYPAEYKDLLNIFTILKKYNMQFGYRVMNEISLYMCNVSTNTSYAKKSIIALDLQLLQKVLPKFHGAYDKLWKPLVEVLNSCMQPQIKSTWKIDIGADELIDQLSKDLSGTKLTGLELTKQQVDLLFKYPRTAVKILIMINDLNTVGFATFIK